MPQLVVCSANHEPQKTSDWVKAECMAMLGLLREFESSLLQAFAADRNQLAVILREVMVSTFQRPWFNADAGIQQLPQYRKAWCLEDLLYCIAAIELDLFFNCKR